MHELKQETKQKISLALKGKSKPHRGAPHSLEARMKMSDSHEGLKMSDSVKIKISSKNIRRKLTAEQRKKVSEANRGRSLSAESIEKMKAHTNQPVVHLESGREFINMTQAAKEFGISIATVSRNCNRQTSSSIGTFRFKEGKK